MDIIKILEIGTGFTLAALALYFFVGRAEESAKFIRAGAEAYERGVGVFTNVK